MPFGLNQEHCLEIELEKQRAEVARLQRERDQIELDLIRMAERNERLRTWLGDSEMTVGKLRAALEGLNDWMREPDFAAACDLEWLTEWANRRPISAVRKALAKED